MDYSKMSDFEINKAVAAAKRYPIRQTQHFGDASLSIVMLEPGYPSHFDPCNNPADAWPIIEANNIAVIPYRHTLPQAWPTAFGLTSRFTTEDENPLRAAMIVILKLQEPANVPVNPPGTDLR